MLQLNSTVKAVIRLAKEMNGRPCLCACRYHALSVLPKQDCLLHEKQVGHDHTIHRDTARDNRIFKGTL